MGLDQVEVVEELNQAAKDAIFSLVAQYPPFGLHAYVLRLKLERRLNQRIGLEAILAFLSEFYVLEVWKGKYADDLVLEEEEPFEFNPERDVDVLDSYSREVPTTEDEEESGGIPDEDTEQPSPNALVIGLKREADRLREGELDEGNMVMWTTKRPRRGSLSTSTSRPQH